MFSFLVSLLKNRSIVWSLAKNDIRSRFLGSFLGVLWVFLLPLVNLSIMWFAFEIGLKSGKQGGVPFILWLVTGMFPWTFFSDALLNSTNSVLEKSFLVKKIVFNVELLPLVKIVASMVLFVFLIFIMILLFLFYGLYPDIYWTQLIYYSICLLLLVMSLAWFTSSIVVFYRDLGQIVNVALQIGFWATPIFWSPSMLPKKLAFVTFLNPVNYVVSGFRDSLILKKWFWEYPGQAIYFWGFTICFFIIGLLIFRKLRPHFADVL